MGFVGFSLSRSCGSDGFCVGCGLVGVVVMSFVASCGCCCDGFCSFYFLLFFFQWWWLAVGCMLWVLVHDCGWWDDVVVICHYFNELSILF